MKRKSDWLAGLIFLLLVTLSACMMGDGFTSLKGKVLDEKGKPIQGAKIMLAARGSKEESESWENGSYNLLVNHAPGAVEPVLTVTKEGFETYRQQFKSEAELGPERDIVLKAQPLAKGQ